MIIFRLQNARVRESIFDLKLKGRKAYANVALKSQFASKPEMLPPKLEPYILPWKNFCPNSNRKQAYFFNDDNGNRSGSIVFDLKNSSEIPGIAEPWYLAFNAKISFRPVMNPQDLAKAAPAIAKAGQQYGK